MSRQYKFIDCINLSIVEPYRHCHQTKPMREATRERGRGRLLFVCHSTGCASLAPLHRWNRTPKGTGIHSVRSDVRTTRVHPFPPHRCVGTFCRSLQLRLFVFTIPSLRPFKMLVAVVVYNLLSIALTCRLLSIESRSNFLP